MSDQPKEIERIGGPAHGKYVPFERGHTRSMTHGSYASELRLSADPRVAELAGAIRESQPVSHPADEGAVQRLAMVYRRLEISAAALDEADRAAAEHPSVGYSDKAQWLARLREDHARWIREAGRIEADLARTPASRAKLGLHLALGQKALTVVELHAAAALEAAGEGESA